MNSQASDSAVATDAATTSGSLSLDEYDVYGFDIDHTLAKYKIPDLFTVSCSDHGWKLNR